MVVVNLKIKSFVRRIRENFLEIDLDRHLDVGEASAAHPDGRRGELCADQDSLVDRLESEVRVDRRTLGNADQPLPHFRADREADLLLAHLTWAVHEVIHMNGVRSGSELGHDDRFYAFVGRTPADGDQDGGMMDTGASSAFTRTARPAPASSPESASCRSSGTPWAM